MMCDWSYSIILKIIVYFSLITQLKRIYHKYYFSSFNSYFIMYTSMQYDFLSTTKQLIKKRQVNFLPPVDSETKEA